MAATKTTSEGILALWRQGRETIPNNPINEELSGKLFIAGRVSLPALLELTYCSQGFEYPGISSIVSSEFDGADRLIDAAIRAEADVVCVRYRNARLGEIATMRDALRQGFSSVTKTTRELVEIKNPYLSSASEAARLALVGGLYIPQPRIVLPDATVQLGLSQATQR